MATEKINRIIFEHEVIVSDLTLENRLHSIWERILFYPRKQGDYEDQGGIISGTYIETFNLQHTIDEVFSSQRSRGALDNFREIFNTDGTLVDEAASMCRGSSGESGLLMIDTFVLNPEYRHIGIGIEAIRAMVRNYARDNCGIAIYVEPAQLNDSSWMVSDLPEESEKKQEFRELGLAVDLTEFEKLTFEESRTKLLTHFGRFGFRPLKDSETLMVADKAEILVELGSHESDDLG